MKTQIIKIIPCLLAGFILSACVGAVNLAEGAVENIKNNTKEESIVDDKDSEPIVVDPEVALINRCTTKDLANDASCAPIVADHPCIEDPFGGACDITFTDYYKIARVNRISFCRENPKHDLCISAVKNVCGDNPFDELCGNNFINTRNAIIGRCRTDNTDNFCPQAIASVCGADSLDTLCNGLTAYFPAQYAACENDNTNRRCNPTIARVCGADSLDVLCAGKTTYFPVQKTACEGKQNPDRCAPIIAGICKADSLDMICNGLTAYLPAQKRACIYEYNRNRCTLIIASVCGADIFDSLCNSIETYHPEQKRICESEPSSPRCGQTVFRVCRANPFDSLCDNNETYYYVKETTCADEPSSPRCAQTIMRVCGDNPFNSLCDDNQTYFPAKEMTCASEPNSRRCHPTIARVCGETPFNTLCQSVNLTLRDFPMESYFIEIGGKMLLRFFNFNTFRTSIGQKTLHSNCFNGQGGGCFIVIPEVINIKPLNDTNTGTATYAGSISLQFYSNTQNNIYNAPLTQDIDIIADFGDNTLSYSGNLGSSDNPFNINGNFTDRGILTGTVDFRSSETMLYGLIGQDEMIGVFAAESGGFAGGFTATREE